MVLAALAVAGGVGVGVGLLLLLLLPFVVVVVVAVAAVVVLVCIVGVVVPPGGVGVVGVFLAVYLVCQCFWWHFRCNRRRWTTAEYARL